MRVNCVNIIEYYDNNIVSLNSFTDDDKGNEEAENLFREKAKKNTNYGDEDIEECLDDGIIEMNNGYQLFIFHS